MSKYYHSYLHKQPSKVGDFSQRRKCLSIAMAKRI